MSKTSKAQPTTPAEFEKAAILQSQAQVSQIRKDAPVAILPGGVREDATPYINTRYTMNEESKVLGEPETIIKDEYKAENPGFHYEWPIASARRTQAYINAGRYKAVPFTAIDKENPYAMVSQSPTGDTVWGQHILVAISPQVYNEEKIQPEEYAKARAAQNRGTIEAEINRNFGRGGYKGQYGIEDVRKER